MKIYTRQGDQGHTGLFDGTRVSKDHWRIETYGTVDELNSTLGLAIAMCIEPALQTLLLKIQHQLFDLGADLATPVDSPNAHRVRRISPADTEFLEKQIDLADARLTPLREFVLPGGTMPAAQLHVARTVCRRAERRLVTLMQHEKLDPQPLIYLNRLSDLLFILARLANHLENKMDVPWQPGGA